MDSGEIRQLVNLIKQGVKNGRTTEQIAREFLAAKSGGLEYMADQGNPLAARACVEIGRIMPHLINAGDV